MPTAFFVIPPRKKNFSRALRAREKFFSFPTVLGVQDWRVPSFFPNALQTLEGRFPFPAALFFNFSYPHRPRRTPLQLDTYGWIFHKQKDDKNLVTIIERILFIIKNSF